MNPSAAPEYIKALDLAEYGRSIEPVGPGRSGRYPEGAVCLVPGCAGTIRSKWLCNMHEWRWRMHGDVGVVKQGGHKDSQYCAARFGERHDKTIVGTVVGRQECRACKSIRDKARRKKRTYEELGIAADPTPIPGLREVRQKLGLSMAAFGNLVGVADSTIHRLEHGHTARPKTVKKLLLAITRLHQEQREHQMLKKRLYLP